MAVAECGKMLAAAKNLYISQSSVSQAILAIEKEYGVLLFERLGHSLHLTQVGEELLAYARTLKVTRNEMDSFLMSANGIRQLRIGATVTVGTCVICPIIEPVKNRYHGIRLAVDVANTHLIEEKLLKNDIDIGLVEGTITNNDIIFEEVIEDSLILICPRGHRFYGKEEVSIHDLRDENMILREKGSGTRALFENEMADAGAPINVTWNCYNSEAIKNAVEAGNGVSVISYRLVEKELEDGHLWGCRIGELDLKRYFSLAYHRNKFKTPEIEAFIQSCWKYQNDRNISKCLSKS